MSALLDIEDLHVTFATDDGVARAVNGVSLRVEPGQTLGVVGGIRVRQKRDLPGCHGPDTLPAGPH